MDAISRRDFLRVSAAGAGALWLLTLTGAKTEAAAQHTRTPPTATTPASIVHQPANVPMLLNGRRLESLEELTAYNTPLYYTPLRKGSKHVLAAFSSREEMLKAHADEGLVCASNAYHAPEQVSFYQDMNMGGSSRSLAPGYGYPDLTRVRLGWFNDWNDEISSVSACRYNVALFEHINYGGSQFFIPAGCSIAYLEGVGWNDRASSIVNWGS